MSPQQRTRALPGYMQAMTHRTLNSAIRSGYEGSVREHVKIKLQVLEPLTVSVTIAIYAFFLCIDLSLYQIFLKSTVYEIASQVKRPWKGMDLGKNVCKKKVSKNVRNFATVAVKFTS